MEILILIVRLWLYNPDISDRVVDQTRPNESVLTARAVSNQETPRRGDERRG